MHIVGEREMGEGLAAGVEAVKPLVGAYPEVAAGIAQQTHHVVGIERRGVVLHVEERLKVVAVEAVQAVVGGYPDASLAVLAEMVDEAARKQTGGQEMARLAEGGAEDGDVQQNQQ